MNHAACAFSFSPVYVFPSFSFYSFFFLAFQVFLIVSFFLLLSCSLTFFLGLDPCLHFLLGRQVVQQVDTVFHIEYPSCPKWTNETSFHPLSCLQQVCFDLTFQLALL